METSGEFSCPVCLDVVNEAVESSCCHHIFCETCVARLRDNNCALCRQPATYTPAIAMRRIVGNLTCRCGYCQQQFTRGEIKNHQITCGPMECQIDQCRHKCDKKDFMNHLSSHHTEYVLKNVNRLFAAATNQEHHTTDHDPIAVRINEAGRTARLGSTGKYYCGGVLELPCFCCNGHCGPNNGCNCAHCMKLDVEARMLPQGYLVNRDGAIARKGAGGIFYCGRKVMESNNHCDGYCGPTNGPNCFACGILDAPSFAIGNAVE